jgi:hypothetical protein
MVCFRWISEIVDVGVIVVVPTTRHICIATQPTSEIKLRMLLGINQRIGSGKSERMRCLIGKHIIRSMC